MKVSVTFDLDTDQLRALNQWFDKPGLATEADVRRIVRMAFCQALGEAETCVILANEKENPLLKRKKV